jgi:hypothetical protein
MFMTHSFLRDEQDAEKSNFLTHPTPARHDAHCPKRRSRVAQRLNVPTGKEL